MFRGKVTRRSRRKGATPKLPSLSHKEALILELLVKSGRRLYGLEMVQESRGELKRGTIYVTLQRMTEKGYVTSAEEARAEPKAEIPRRVYWATGLGERAYQAYEMFAAAHAIHSEPIFSPGGG